MKKAIIEENDIYKYLKSEVVNYRFNKTNGEMITWGKDLKTDAVWSPFGPFILDLEISSGGDCLGNCPFCYKSNSGDQPTHNLTFNQFKDIFHKMPKTLTQIAFGIMNIKTNPDFFDMMIYVRENGVIPNFTCHGLDVTPEIAKRVSEICGAVAVSVYDRESSYNAIKMFTDTGMRQVNIHFMVSKQTFETAKSVINDIATDPRLAKLNAIVLLNNKPKGRSYNNFTSLKIKDYGELIQLCEKLGINYGMDSCGAANYLQNIKDRPDSMNLAKYVEGCESTLFSSYINCKGEFYPCSFFEQHLNWQTGISVFECNDFLKEIWFNPKTIKFRETLVSSTAQCNCKFKHSCRSCPGYDITECNNYKL